MDRIITVDGPSGVGKGTVSRAIAKALHWRWLDSGALYRLTAYAAMQHNIGLDDIVGLVNVAKSLDVKFSVDETQIDPDIYLSGKVVNHFIRTEQCGAAASKIAANPEVRTALLQRQRDFLTEHGLVADGRDMGTIVFPEAPLKIFLQASVEVRALRRQRQLQQQGADVNMSRLLQEIAARDERDRNRTIAPLVPADDAIIIDTSNLTVQEVCDKILAEAKRIGLC
jgi:cytidylate kinase